MRRRYAIGHDRGTSSHFRKHCGLNPGVGGAEALVRVIALDRGTVGGGVAAAGLSAPVDFGWLNFFPDIE